MLNIKVVSWSLAISTAFSYALCIVYGLLIPGSAHMVAFLQQVLTWFEPNSWSGFGLGLIQSFLYGAFGGIVYVPVYNLLYRKWVAPPR